MRIVCSVDYSKYTSSEMDDIPYDMWKYTERQY